MPSGPPASRVLPVPRVAPVSSVLFVCNWNMIRSPMAEALLKHRHRGRVFADSAGIRAGEAADPFAVAVMAELDIDLSRHRPKALSDVEDFNIDLIVTLAPEAHHRAMEMTRTIACEVEYWTTPDPTAVIGARATVLAAYRDLRDYLEDRVARRFG